MNNEQFNNEDYLDPKYWKWGLFYFNKNDKRIFPPKRIKAMGFTTNFANPISMIALVGIVLIINLLVLLFLK